MKNYGSTKRILITGGAGFLGSHLAKSLLLEGHEVICLDNLTTGKLANLTSLSSSDRFKFIECDVINLPDLKIDEIYNLACPASPPKYQLDPIQTLNTCYLGVKKCLELAMRNDAKIVQASTSEIYGDPAQHPQAEGYWGNVNPIGPRSCYDEGKRIGETLCLEYHRKYKIQTRVARIFNTYGPFMDKNDGRVISNFINQALTHQNLTVYGDGSQTRSFCYVSDLIEGLKLLMEHEERDFQPINLGNPSEHTVYEIAKKILTLTGSSSTIQYCPLPGDDPKIRQPNISLASNALGWFPKVSLTEGLNDTIRYFISKINQAK